MKITISGQIGSGKSTIARMLAAKLNLEYFSIGKIMQDLARERNLSLEQLQDIAKNDESIDSFLDEKQLEIATNHDNFVMDSRLGFYFIPDSIKIFLKADFEERVKRVFEDPKRNYKSIEEARQKIKERELSEEIRYRKYYKINFQDRHNFDIIIDTTNKKPEEVVEEIIKRVKEKTSQANLKN